MQNIEYAKTHFADTGFSQYSTAYVATNEDLRTALKCMPESTHHALTVATSGDHPMFTKLYGAKHVDTFDISFNAQLIMDIKTSALNLLSYEEYCQLIKNLYESEHIAFVPNMPKIMERLSPFEQQYIKEMHGQRLFSKQINSISLPTKTEFQKMRQVINKPFNFIWSDIKTLHNKLTKTYDFMHLSNIFDYVGTYQNCIDILNSLTQHTVPGCKICFTCFNKDTEAICEKFIWLQKLHRDTEQLWTAHKIQMMDNTCVMHRVR